MRRREMILAAVLTAAALLAWPGAADACMQCSPSRPVCERANYSQCDARLRPDGSGTCEQWATNCAWVQNVSEVSADGSLAVGYTPAEVPAGAAAGEVALGCHGLILARDYPEAKVAHLRRESRTLRI